MAFDVNEVTIIGRLGAAPEVKSFSNGGRIANLRVATSESWKDKQSGERSERTEWSSVTLRTDYLIDYASKHLRKGSRVYVRGKLQTRKWQDKSSNDRYSTEIVVAGYEGKLLGLDAKPASSGQKSEQSGTTDGYDQQDGSGGYRNETGGGGSNYDDLDDDIPF